MTHFVRLLLLAAATAVGTVAVGWWAVPVVAAAWGVLTRAERGGALSAGVAAMVAWGALLALDAARGPVGVLVALLGGVLQIRPVGVYALTLAYPGLLAVCAALVARAAVSARR